MPKTVDIPDNKFRIFYDHDAGHYRVLIDGRDLSMSLGMGGVKVDFSVMKDDEFASPEVTLTFPAAGGLDLTLKDGQTISDPGQPRPTERRCLQLCCPEMWHPSGHPHVSGRAAS